MTLDELRALLAKVTGENFEPYEEEVTQDEEELYELVGERGEDVVSATVTFLEQSSASLDVDSVRTALQDNYRGEHVRFGDFIREEKLGYIENDAGAVKIFEELADYVDWAAYAEDDTWSDYTAVRKYPEGEPETTVYVFRD